MPDERARSKERRFLETGAPEDEAAWLRTALRTGRLSGAAGTLAADLGHRPALAALGRPASGEIAFERLESVLWDYAPSPGPGDGAARAPAPREALVRAYLAVCGLVSSGPEVLALEAWIACPCAPHFRAAERAVARSWSGGLNVCKGLRDGFAQLCFAAEDRAPGSVGRALTAALVPWALGYDPADRSRPGPPACG